MYDNPRFRWEPVAQLFAEPNAADLLREHHATLGVHRDKLHLDINLDLMQQAEAEGRFRVWTARDDGLLVGYLGLWIIRHMHYPILMAVEDSFLLSAPNRRGYVGIRMIQGVSAALREMGVELLIIHEKVHFAAERGGLGKFYRRLGFEHTDNLWSKILS